MFSIPLACHKTSNGKLYDSKYSIMNLVENFLREMCIYYYCYHLCNTDIRSQENMKLVTSRHRRHHHQVVFLF